MGDPDKVGRKFLILLILFLIPIMFAFSWMYSGEIEVTGQVVDRFGKPLPHAKVMYWAEYTKDIGGVPGSKRVDPEYARNKTGKLAQPLFADANGMFHIDVDHFLISYFRLAIETDTTNTSLDVAAQNTDVSMLLKGFEPETGFIRLFRPYRFGSRDNPLLFRVQQQAKQEQPQKLTSEQDKLPVEEKAAEEEPKDSRTQEILALLKQIQEKIPHLRLLAPICQKTLLLNCRCFREAYGLNALYFTIS